MPQYVIDLDSTIEFGKHSEKMTFRELFLSEDNSHMGYVIWLAEENVLRFTIDSDRVYFNDAVTAARKKYVDPHLDQDSNWDDDSDEDQASFSDLSEHGDH
jgi:hypothetical protein